MNKQPKYYMQTDKNWKDYPYRVKGESATVGDSGCGPTCAAMLIETITGKKFTPPNACDWSLEHGYKAKDHGTYYSYFVPQFQNFCIKCIRLTGNSIYGNPTNPIHQKVKNFLKQGWYAIALMGKGMWTNTGHFIVIYDWDKDILINDPASKRQTRIKTNESTFCPQVKQYWIVDGRKVNKPMTKDELRKMLEDIENDIAKKPESKWAQKNGVKQIVQGMGISVEADRPQSYATREEVWQMIIQLYKFMRGENNG